MNGNLSLNLLNFDNTPLNVIKQALLNDVVAMKDVIRVNSVNRFNREISKGRKPKLKDIFSALQAAKTSNEKITYQTVIKSKPKKIVAKPIQDETMEDKHTYSVNVLLYRRREEHEIKTKRKKILQGICANSRR